MLGQDVTLTFDPLTLKICSTSCDPCLCQIMSEIEQPAAELLIIYRL